MRDFVFVSHANPEDNEFALWVTLQLAKEGYPVWCDLTRLLGGEDFWIDIEKAIRERAVKFMYVLSKTSNAKPGPLKELTVAENVARDNQLSDFIIPLHIDRLAHREINIQLGRLNAIAFDKGWAGGLHTLLEKLEKDGIQKNPSFTPEAVTSWWRSEFSAKAGLKGESDELFSNWFEILNLPSKIYFHILFDSGSQQSQVKTELPYPAFQHHNYIVTFAKADDFENKLGESIRIGDTHDFATEDFISGRMRQEIIKRKEARAFVIRLLRLGWERMVKQNQLPMYELANEVQCFYFSKGLVEHDTVSFPKMGGGTAHRSVVGYKTVKATESREESKRYWHFGIQARPLVYPRQAYCIKPHVVFSDDGQNIWEGKLRLHRARRSQCKNWWNDEWRDRMLAAMFWLAKEGQIELQFGSDLSAFVSHTPLAFTSPVSYSDPDKHPGDFEAAEKSEDDEFDELDEGDLEEDES